MSWHCHASCTIRGQLSMSVTGAFQLLGKPVVSVSKTKNIILLIINFLQIWYCIINTVL